MPAEKSKDFSGLDPPAARHDAARALRRDRRVLRRLGSVTLTVIGPADPRPRHRHHRRRLRQARRHRLRPALRNTLLVAIGLYVASSALLVPAVVPAGRRRAAHDVPAAVRRRGQDQPAAAALHRQPAPRRPAVSRVTNDIDNIAQSLQQTLSQLLTSVLTIVGVLAMMFVISPILALVAAVTIPTSLLLVKFVTSPLEEAVRRAVAPHRHAQRAGRGGVHRARARQGVRPAGRTSRSGSATRTRSCTTPASARSSSPARSSRR